MSASATLAPARRNAAPAAAPLLRVVHGGATQPEAERRGLTKAHVGCAAVAGVLALLFVLAVMQTAIAQGQAHLDDVSAQTTDRQAEAQELRLQVAQLESPERIIDEAQTRLGMVEPETITYVAPADPSQPVVAAPPAPPLAEDPGAGTTPGDESTPEVP
jgi:cell division protein FtsL